MADGLFGSFLRKYRNKSRSTRRHRVQCGRVVARGWVAVDQRELVERAGRGDHDAFAVLAGGSIARLEAVARLILGIASSRETRSRRPAFAHGGTCPGCATRPGDAGFRRLTVNACLDVARHRRRRPVEVELFPIAPDFPGGAVLGDSAAALADRDLIERAFRRLHPDQRVVIVLRYYLDLSVPEIAETVGVPVGTAQARLHRGLAVLRAAIAPRRHRRRPGSREGSSHDERRPGRACPGQRLA